MYDGVWGKWRGSYVLDGRASNLTLDVGRRTFCFLVCFGCF